MLDLAALDGDRLAQTPPGDLGPILEGNGWAVNGRVKINIPFGTALTDMAVLPPGAKRSLEDPYEDKDAAARKVKAIVYTVLLVLAAVAIGGAGTNPSTGTTSGSRRPRRWRRLLRPRPHRRCRHRWRR